MMFPIAVGPVEVGIVVVVVVLLFGIKRLPEIGRSLAEGIHEFKKASKKITEEDEAQEIKKGE
ncbi:MAG: twin-arginine translocase TatA/TatE family subunit [Armatimonadota bacterium]|nr:twin-arginine translocase TatA/TatE family subunit [bacterium]